jgi:ATP-binding cassette subfamily C (CFTR/MRP) protein 1
MVCLGIWVKWWAASNVQHPYEKSGYYMGMYVMLGAVALITLCISCWYVLLFQHNH